jgi:hypothetical protein
VRSTSMHRLWQHLTISILLAWMLCLPESASTNSTRSTPNATVEVGGTLSQDTMWTSDTTYVVNHLIVPMGITLTIQPGTQVRFNAAKALVIQGTLIADGSPASRIMFTSNAANPQPGDWGTFYDGNQGGIFFTGTSQMASFDGSGSYLSGSIIRNAIIEYSTGVTLQRAAPFISQNIIRYNSGQGAVFYNGYSTGNPPHAIISHNLIVANIGTSINAQQGETTIQHNLIYGNAGGIYLSDSQVFTDNTLAYNTGGESCGAINGTAAICIAFSNAATQIINNNIYSNNTKYEVALRFDSTQSIDATNNYWGTIDAGTIQSQIYDGNQGLGLGIAQFVPFRMEANLDAPELFGVYLPLTFQN